MPLCFLLFLLRTVQKGPPVSRSSIIRTITADRCAVCCFTRQTEYYSKHVSRITISRWYIEKSWSFSLNLHNNSITNHSESIYNIFVLYFTQTFVYMYFFCFVKLLSSFIVHSLINTFCNICTRKFNNNTYRTRSTQTSYAERRLFDFFFWFLFLVSLIKEVNL